MNFVSKEVSRVHSLLNCLIVTMLKHFLAACLFLVFTLNLAAQKRLRAGTVTYELQQINGKTAGLNMMEGSTLTLTFDGEKQKTDINIMFGVMRFQQIFDLEKDTSFTLYDWLGEQFLVEDTIQETISNALTISYLEDSTRLINGYECYLGIIENEEEKTTFWLTDKIRLNTSWFHQKYPNLKGFPLAYKSQREEVQLHFALQSITPEIDEHSFDIPSQYQILTQEEFAEKMGGWSLHW